MYSFSARGRRKSLHDQCYDHVFHPWFGTLSVVFRHVLPSSWSAVFLQLCSGVYSIAGEHSTSAICYQSGSTRDIPTSWSLATVDPCLCPSRTSDSAIGGSRRTDRRSKHYRTRVATDSTENDFSNPNCLTFLKCISICFAKKECDKKSEIDLGSLRHRVVFSIFQRCECSNAARWE